MIPAGRNRRRRRSEGGAVLVFVGLTLLVLMVTLGLATDAGWTIYVRSQGQAAVDTATLSGASALALYSESKGDPAEVYRRIAALNSENTVMHDSAALTPTDTGSATSVEFVVYDQEKSSITCEAGCAVDEVNAVRVTKAGYDTPVFLGGIRRLFGGPASSRLRIDVSAVGYLGCPLEVTTGPTTPPIALRQCKIGYPASCDVPKIIQSPTTQDNSAFTTFNLTGANACSQIAAGHPPPTLQTTIGVGDLVNLIGSGQVTSCLKALDDRYQHCTPDSCNRTPPDPTCTVVAPVIGCGGSQSVGRVVGFATICYMDITSPPGPKTITASVECHEYVPGSRSGGGCFGSRASNPILVQ